MKRLLNEPLLHFLLLGAVIFAAHSVLAAFKDDEPGSIVVTRGQVESLASGFSRAWQRPPAADELEGLIRDAVQEEVYYREAMALGLDREDTVVRRRLRQKMEFISDDLGADIEATDDQLRVYLAEHPDTFRIEPRYTLTQVYLNPERRGANLARDAAQVLAQLTEPRNSADLSTLGDAFLLERTLQSVPRSELAKQFGEQFAARLDEVAPGRWQGPISSGYGVHLVLLTKRTDPRLPALEEVRDAVQREWAHARRVEANQRFYQSLLSRYTVTIERP